MKSAVFFTLVLLLTAGILNAETKEITIINHSDFIITGLYASPSISDDWGSSLLPENTTLENGAEYQIQLEMEPECEFDFKLVDETGNTLIKWEISICENDVLEFTYEDFSSDEEGGGDYYDDGSDYEGAYSDGYKDGYRDGYREAYDDGYQDGYEAALQELEEQSAGN
ncbi:MAG: hypothetical protein JW874_01760 [Spirochaetales bacterium]|nr:hypothetical protein [Spirochaetales bacterium]